MQTFQHLGQSIAFRTIGTGAPLLLVHGLGAESGQVAAAFGQLKERQLICPDMPGHGASPLSSFGFAAYAGIVLALMGHLGLDQADLGGISMGSGIALAVALADPCRVRRLFLARPAWLDAPALPHLMPIAQVGLRISIEGPLAAAGWLDEELVRIVPGMPAVASSLRTVLTRPQASDAALILPAMVLDCPFVSVDRLSSIACPTLVFGNDRDPLHPAELARRLAAAIPGARYVHLPPRYDAPEDHVDALIRAIEELAVPVRTTDID